MCETLRTTILLYPSHANLSLCVHLWQFSYFQIKLTQSLLNPSLQRGDQGNISNNSTPHYRSVLSETVRHDKTFGLELYRSSQRTNTPLKAPEVIQI